MDSKNKILIFPLILLLTLSACSAGFDHFIPTSAAQELPTFGSCRELNDQLRIYDTEKDKNYRYDEQGLFNMPVPSPAGALSEFGRSSKTDGVGSGDFSHTNVQVEGVDEADMVKTDGKYIYTLFNNKLSIVRALPANEMKSVAVLDFFSMSSSQRSAQEFFINGDQVVVFGSTTLQQAEVLPSLMRGVGIPWEDSYRPGRSGMYMDIFDLSDPQIPALKRHVELEGSYLTSRMIGSQVYAVVNTPQYYDANIENDNGNVLPLYYDSKASFGYKPLADCTQVHYVPNPARNQFLTLLSFPVDGGTDALQKKIIFGAGENVYASTNNLYIARTDYQSYDRPYWLEEFVPEPPQSTEKTDIYKFALNSGNIAYQGEGSVPGSVLNQFSMDEYDGNFRIATTIGYLSQGYSDTTNNIYVLDQNLKQIGSVTDIAPGEKIYSARFMGKRGYLVTFKKVDPFFTFDLSDTKNPKILGKLKIPGYSDYLHPYDENHIIGIGKDTIESSTGNFAWYQGLKMAMFDVTDFNNPKEMFKTTIGDRGTDSPVLTDHKALLFDRSKNLLVLPVSVAEIQDQAAKNKIRGSDSLDQPVYGQTVFQGAYVYNLTLANGFDLKGKISHWIESLSSTGYYTGGFDNAIQRSLYIDDHLYTISPNWIMSHNFKNKLSEEGRVYLYEDPVSSNNNWTIE